jgi:hypothetical protein
MSDEVILWPHNDLTWYILFGNCECLTSRREPRPAIGSGVAVAPNWELLRIYTARTVAINMMTAPTGYHRAEMERFVIPKTDYIRYQKRLLLYPHRTYRNER